MFQDFAIIVGFIPLVALPGSLAPSCVGGENVCNRRRKAETGGKSKDES